jgi:formylglycine-generating enzyme required for sulfatase activity
MAKFCRSAARDSYAPGNSYGNIGFRISAVQTSPPTYSISGQVIGDTQQGVALTLSPGSPTLTDVNGNFSFNGLANGTYTITPSKSGYTFVPASTNVTLNGASVNNVLFTATQSGVAGEYMIIDVSGGPNASTYSYVYQSSTPPVDDIHKTSKIVLRKMPAGAFAMGSPAVELGSKSDETQHNVMLTQPFYIAIYEITQAQYSNVMGANPSYFKQGTQSPKRPVEQVSWNMVRGGTWPGGTPGAATFIGKLRAKTGLSFDLPTEAQWEYACRAGTANALNNNSNLQDAAQDPNMHILGRYYYNGGNSWNSDPVNGGTAVVGSHLVNTWGLYDMHGNVCEWNLDWYAAYTGDATNPNGAATGANRVIRGGSWGSMAKFCRSAARDSYAPGNSYGNIGFRMFLPASQ